MVNQPYEERLYPKTYNAAHETIQYWPMERDEEKVFAPWKIKCLWSKLKMRPTDQASVTDGSQNYVYRITKISLVESNPITNPEPREILHICYYRWPDGQIPSPPPDNPGDFSGSVEIVRDILLLEMKNVRGPTVVHCHAGVGRTGVIIALDIAADRLLSRQFADVRETVRKIREQRPRAVMNVWQYTYINLGLAELAMSRELLPKTMEVPGKKKHTGGGHVKCSRMIAECWKDMTQDFKRCCIRDEPDEFQEFDDG